jgi:tRNA pseudouridine55 synthase
MPRDVHGILVIDKPKGPTSHDVVARLRKALGTRAVGHAGTLDPAATGVLVIAIGEGTKLVPYLTAEKKRYLATVTFGSATTTLDAEGDVVATAPIPDALAAELRAIATRPTDLGPSIAAALDVERARREQIPPAFSAIKTGGQTAHARARRGEEVTLSPRPVTLDRVDVIGARDATLDLELLVSKGYYVRALARDLGETLGVPAHLSALRRLASGHFTLDEALPLSASAEELSDAMRTIADAAKRTLPHCQLTETGLRRARHGQRLAEDDFDSPPAGDFTAWLAPTGELVAIGRLTKDGDFQVERGFTYATSNSST